MPGETEQVMRGLQLFYLNTKTGFWSLLSYMCHIRSISARDFPRKRLRIPVSQGCEKPDSGFLVSEHLVSEHVSGLREIANFVRETGFLVFEHISSF